MKMYLLISVLVSLQLKAEVKEQKKCPTEEVLLLSPSTESDIEQITRKSCELVRDCDELKKIPECLNYVDSTKVQYQSFLEEFFLKEDSENYLDLFNRYLPFYYAMMPHCPQLNFEPVGDEIGLINNFLSDQKKIKSSDQFKNIQKNYELAPDEMKKLEISDHEFSKVLTELLMGKQVDSFYIKNKEIIFSMFDIDRNESVEFRKKSDMLKKKYIEDKIAKRSKISCINAINLPTALEEMGRYLKSNIVSACRSYSFSTSKLGPDSFIYSCLYYCDKQFAQKTSAQNLSLSLGLLGSRSRHGLGRMIASIEEDSNTIKDEDGKLDTSNLTSKYSGQEGDDSDQKVDFSTPEEETKFFEGINIRLNTFNSMISNSVQMNIPLGREELLTMISEISTYRKKLKKKKGSKAPRDDKEKNFEKIETVIEDVVGKLDTVKASAESEQELSDLKKEASTFRDIYFESRRKDAFVRSENARLKNENEFLKRRLEERNREIEQIRRLEIPSGGGTEQKKTSFDGSTGISAGSTTLAVVLSETNIAQKSEPQEVRLHPIDFYSYPYKLKKDASAEEIYNLILKSNGNPIYLGDDEELTPEMLDGKIVLDYLGYPRFKKRKIKIIVDSKYKISTADLSLIDQKEIYRYRLIDLTRSISSATEE